MRDKIGYRVITVIAFALSGCFDVGLETKREGRLDNGLIHEGQVSCEKLYRCHCG